MGAFSTDRRAAVRRGVLGLGSQERYPRILGIHLVPGGRVSLGGSRNASETIMSSNLRRRLKAIADDLRGPLGRIPLDRVLRRHLDLFEELRREGCTWLQLARTNSVMDDRMETLVIVVL
jgi:hypothetical protein